MNSMVQHLGLRHLPFSFSTDLSARSAIHDVLALARQQPAIGKANQLILLPKAFV
jgi:hypothetical protein